MARKAVYAGSFDPPTKAHLWMIEQGAIIFDHLLVSVGVNPDKNCVFSVEERKEMLRASTQHLGNVTVDSFAGQFLYRHAVYQQAKFVLRGIRKESDYEYERIMRNVNGDLSSSVTTIFLIPPRELAEISSSLVRGMVGPEGWEEVVSKYVTDPVRDALARKYQKKRLVKDADIENYLKQRWDELWQKRKKERGEGKLIAFTIMRARYQESHRQYHTLRHIYQCYQEFDEVIGQLAWPDAIEATIWFHDAIYEPKKNNNEQESSNYAFNVLVRAGQGGCFARPVSNFILYTDYSKLPGVEASQDHKYLHDIDLSVFGQPWDEIIRWEEGIRYEYAWVPEKTYLTKRIEILAGFLKQEPIYLTEYFQKKYETRAKENLARLIQHLRKQQQ